MRRRLHAGLARRHDERRAHAEHVELGVGRELPQRREIRVPGIAVEQRERRAGEQPAHEVVPHHPAGGGEPAEAVAGADVVMQRERLEVLDHDAAVAVHDRLRESRRARAVEHVQRMVERHRLELDRLVLGEQRRPVVGALAEVRDVHRVLERRERGFDRAHFVTPVDDLLAVAVAVDREQHLRLDLCEAVDDRAGPELRRARRPDRAQARGRRERDQRLLDVRRVRRDPIALGDTEPAQTGATARDRVDELGPRELTRGTRSGCERRSRRRRAVTPPAPAPARPS